MATKEAWLDEALALCPEIVRREADAYLRPLMKRCHAKSKKTFWQFLRINLAKTEETASFLTWMQERFVAEEAPSSDGFTYEVNGDVALIAVGNEEHAVWRVPLETLDWARAVWPVYLKKLPPLECRELEQIRELKKELKRPSFSSTLTHAQRMSFKAEIDQLKAQVDRAYTPLPRYALMKAASGSDVPVHRLFLNANEDQEVIAIDDDFLNFATTKITVTVQPEVQGGYAARPRRESISEFWVPNLQIVGASDAQQREFEENFLPIKTTLQGDISMRLPIQPNADLGRRAGCYGKVTDCGKFRPVTVEQYSPERFASKVRNAWGIRRK
jgi:hypothetical protein